MKAKIEEDELIRKYANIDEIGYKIMISTDKYGSCYSGTPLLTLNELIELKNYLDKFINCKLKNEK